MQAHQDPPVSPKLQLLELAALLQHFEELSRRLKDKLKKSDYAIAAFSPKVCSYYFGLCAFSIITQQDFSLATKDAVEKMASSTDNSTLPKSILDQIALCLSPDSEKRPELATLCAELAKETKLAPDKSLNLTSQFRNISQLVQWIPSLHKQALAQQNESKQNNECYTNANLAFIFGSLLAEIAINSKITTLDDRDMQRLLSGMTISNSAVQQPFQQIDVTLLDLIRASWNSDPDERPDLATIAKKTLEAANAMPIRDIFKLLKESEPITHDIPEHVVMIKHIIDKQKETIDIDLLLQVAIQMYDIAAFQYLLSTKQPKDINQLLQFALTAFSKGSAPIILSLLKAGADLNTEIDTSEGKTTALLLILKNIKQYFPRNAPLISSEELSHLLEVITIIKNQPNLKINPDDFWYEMWELLDTKGLPVELIEKLIDLRPDMLSDSHYNFKILTILMYVNIETPAIIKRITNLPTQELFSLLLLAVQQNRIDVLNKIRENDPAIVEKIRYQKDFLHLFRYALKNKQYSLVRELLDYSHYSPYLSGTLGIVFESSESKVEPVVGELLSTIMSKNVLVFGHCLPFITNFIDTNSLHLLVDIFQKNKEQYQIPLEEHLIKKILLNKNTSREEKLNFYQRYYLPLKENGFLSDKFQKFYEENWGKNANDLVKACFEHYEYREKFTPYEYYRQSMDDDILDQEIQMVPVIEKKGIDLMAEYYSDKYDTSISSQVQIPDKKLAANVPADIAAKEAHLIENFFNNAEQFLKPLRENKSENYRHAFIIGENHRIPVIYIKEKIIDKNGESKIHEGILYANTLSDLTPFHQLQDLQKRTGIPVFVVEDTRQSDHQICGIDAMVVSRDATAKDKKTGAYRIPNLLAQLKDRSKPKDNYHSVLLPNELLKTAQISAFVTKHQEEDKTKTVHTRSSGEKENLQQFRQRHTYTNVPIKDVGNVPSIASYGKKKGVKFANLIEVQFYLNQLLSIAPELMTVPENKKQFIRQAKAFLKDKKIEGVVPRLHEFALGFYQKHSHQKAGDQSRVSNASSPKDKQQASNLDTKLTSKAPK